MSNRPLIGRTTITIKEAANLLEVASPDTVKNWLEGGCFPGAYKMPGGHWRFPRHEVLAMKEHMAEVHRRNDRNDMTPPECDDEPPLL